MDGWVVSQGTLLDDFEDASQWSAGSEGTVSNDTAHVKTGTKSLKLQTDGTGASSSFQATKTVSLDLSRAGCLAMWVYVENDVDTSNLKLRITSDSTFTKYFEYVMASDIHEGWNYVLMGRSQWTNVGSESWQNTMVRLRLIIGGGSTSQVGTVYVDSLYINVYSRPKCMIFFDDQPNTTYTLAYPYMRKYGFKGVIPIISSTVGTNGKCSLAELTEMHTYGWDMVNHTVNHNALGTLTPSQMVDEITGCTRWLAQNGFTRRNEHKMLAYPLSSEGTTVWPSVISSGIIAARGNHTRTQPNQLDNYLSLCGLSNDSGTTAADIKAKIDKAIAEGGCAMLYFHILRTEDIATTLDPAIFYEVVDYLATKRQQIDVVTMSEWYDGLTRGRRLV